MSDLAHAKCCELYPSTGERQRPPAVAAACCADVLSRDIPMLSAVVFGCMFAFGVLNHIRFVSVLRGLAL